MDPLLEFNVSFYTEIPQGIELFHKICFNIVERLNLYQIFKHREIATIPTIKNLIKESPLRLLLETTESPEVKEARKIDYISHFFARILYCDSYPQFFVENEKKWFQLRFNNMPHETRMKFLEKNGIELPQATEEEKEKWKLKKEQVWYKVPSSDVPYLIAKRLCPLHEGFAYIPTHKVVFYLLQKLDKYLTGQLTHIKQMLGNMPDEFKTVRSLMEVVPPHNNTSHRILELSELDEQSKHFPLCMKVQLEALRKNHHLKHPSRVQLGLFLKELGLSLDEALQMWREEFTNKMTEDFFNKEYSYFFRHQYGTVGSKIRYVGQSCEQILGEEVGAGQVNGCPFKVWDCDTLSERLKSEDFTADQIGKVLELKNEGRCREACTKYFQCVKGCPIDVVNHPVTYYDTACNIEVADIEDLFVEEE